MTQLKPAGLPSLVVIIPILWATGGWHRTYGWAAQASGEPAAPFQQEIERDLIKLPRSLAAADKEALLARYLPEQSTVLFYPGPGPDQLQIRGWPGISSFWDEYFKKYRHIQLSYNSEPKIVMLGVGAVATNTFSYEATQASDLRKIYGYGRITVVYIRVDGHPQVVHEHLSYLTAATSAGGGP